MFVLFLQANSVVVVIVVDFGSWFSPPLFELFVLFLQANSVMTEYSTSIAQKIIYIFACLGKHSKSNDKTHLHR